MYKFRSREIRSKWREITMTQIEESRFVLNFNHSALFLYRILKTQKKNIFLKKSIFIYLFIYLVAFFGTADRRDSP